MRDRDKDRALRAGVTTLQWGVFLFGLWLTNPVAAWADECPPQAYTTITSSGSHPAIPDGGTATKTLTMSVNQPIGDVNLTLNIQFNRVGHLAISIESPSGTIVDLVTEDDLAGANLTNCHINDEAEDDIADQVAPYEGTWYTDGDLSDFDEENAAGTWRLHVTDETSATWDTQNGEQDSGSILNFTVSICTADDAEAPDPSITYPAECQVLPSGPLTITWTNEGGPVFSWSLDYQLNNDGAWPAIVSGLDPGATSYTWQDPIQAGAIKIRLTGLEFDDSTSDETGNFGIGPQLNVYVNRYADPPGDGSVCNPFTLLLSGIDAVETGGSVWIGAGNYPAPGMLTRAMVLRAWNGTVTIGGVPLE